VDVAQVNAVAFADGIPSQVLEKTILLDVLGTVLRRFNIVRSKKDGIFKYVRIASKGVDS
jgi:hypothetical protein